MTQRNPIAPDQVANPRVAELHRLAREDYAEGQRERAAARVSPSHTAPGQDPIPADLDVAIHVGQHMLATYGTVDGDIFAYAQAHGGLTEALRILLRALDAEPREIRHASGVERGEGQ